jgi:hypothetical protein
MTIERWTLLRGPAGVAASWRQLELRAQQPRTNLIRLFRGRVILGRSRRRCLR